MRPARSSVRPPARLPVPARPISPSLVDLCHQNRTFIRQCIFICSLCKLIALCAQSAHAYWRVRVVGRSVQVLYRSWSVRLSVSPSVSPCVGRLVRRSVGPSVGRSVHRSVGLSVGPSVGGSVGGSFGVSVAPSVSQSFGPTAFWQLGMDHIFDLLFALVMLFVQ